MNRPRVCVWYTEITDRATGGRFRGGVHVPKGLATLCSFLFFFFLSFFPRGKTRNGNARDERPPFVWKKKANLSSWTCPRDNTRIRANLSTIRNATDSFPDFGSNFPFPFPISLCPFSLRFRSLLPHGKIRPFLPTPFLPFSPPISDRHRDDTARRRTVRRVLRRPSRSVHDSVFQLPTRVSKCVRMYVHVSRGLFSCLFQRDNKRTAFAKDSSTRHTPINVLAGGHTVFSMEKHTYLYTRYSHVGTSTQLRVSR